ncbi:hypothetical protein GWR56_11905 [Mucilaginibacter sp. 14171R-50]|uniref:hypothetical protein n=1 Tax=Mucilaginibacter sp. 14171R-50 TaxID=2703789 RepID=UPI00138CBFB1|nr:hypothetical protein [Mucilaginibacter sp. 14171R-50]QHS56204.1 hypothetical protein GWR56_11905 [Mucilaginibacter sp. 14171R-50]
MKIEKGTKVKLKTFSGELTPKKGTDPSNNYWKLIGEKGEVITDERYNERVLVLFEKNLDQFGVANHNPTINSLWILPADLELDTK